MKFLVDQLPYYDGACTFWRMCWNNTSKEHCPRFWDKYKVTSDENPHECDFLVETKGK